MTTPAPDAPPADAIPRRCGACGYRLDGLAVAGRCPECGGDYDGAGGAVTLLGWGAGERATAGNQPSWAAAVPVVFSLAWFAWVISTFGWGQLGRNALSAAALGGLAAFYLVAVGRRLLDPAGVGVPPARVVVGPVGYGQADGHLPTTLRPWRRDDAVEVGPAPRPFWRHRSAGREIRLRVGPRRVAWWRYQPVTRRTWWRSSRRPDERVDVVFEATAAQADALRRRLSAWRRAAGGDAAGGDAGPRRWSGRDAVRSAE